MEDPLDKRSHEPVNDDFPEAMCIDEGIDVASNGTEANVSFNLPEPKLAPITDVDAALLKLMLEKSMSNGVASSVAR